MKLIILFFFIKTRSGLIKETQEKTVLLSRKKVDVLDLSDTAAAQLLHTWRVLAGRLCGLVGRGVLWQQLSACCSTIIHHWPIENGIGSHLTAADGELWSQRRGQKPTHLHAQTITECGMNQHQSKHIRDSLSFSHSLWTWPFYHPGGSSREQGQPLPYHPGHGQEAPSSHHCPARQHSEPPSPLQESSPTPRPDQPSRSTQLLWRRRRIHLTPWLSAHLLHLAG